MTFLGGLKLIRRQFTTARIDGFVVVEASKPHAVTRTVENSYYL
jgi:hypothetical protein